MPGAKSIQLSLTLCNTIDSLQHYGLFAKVESNFLQHYVAHQAPLSMGFSRQEYWSGLLCPPPGDIPNPRIEPVSLLSPAWAGGFFTTSTTLVQIRSVAQSCPTLCDLMDYSPPGASVHGILQARILEWVAVPSSRGFSQSRDQTQVFYIS